MRVFCIGDSLTLGKGDAERLGWVGRLPMIDDVEYYNLGVAGQTIAQILERAYHEISARMVPYHDNLIIMGGGLNDLCLDEESKLRTDKEILKAQIDAWMGAMKHLAPTLCIGPLPISEDYNPYFNSTLGKDVTFKNVVIDEFDAIYSQTSAAHDVPYLSLYHLLKDDPSYKDALNDGDGIHPSEMGYVGIAEYLSNWKALRSHLPDAKANKEKKMTDAYIYDSVRSPRGKGRPDGSLHATTSLDLSKQMVNAILERNDFNAAEIDDLIWGNVTQIGEQGACLARTVSLVSDLPESVSGLSINRFCASGLEAVNLAARQVMSGESEAYIAGGVEMMSRVPMGSDGAAIAADPQAAMGTYFVPQGISADVIATKYGITREDADAFAVESQKRAAAAWQGNRFEKTIVPVRDVNGRVLLEADEYMRPATDMAALASLNPAFQMMGEVMPGFDAVAKLKYPELERVNHIHHAGNSSGIVDGSAAVLIGSKEFGERNGLKARARIRATANIGTEPTIMLTGPVPVTERILARTGMSIKDIDLFEVNEAFSAVVLRFMQAFDVSHDVVNVNGGAIAMGHPLGATGTIILGTALDELERSDKETALITLCVASGMGAATILERV